MTVNNLAVLEREDGHLEQSAVLFRRALDSFSTGAGRPPPAHGADADQSGRSSANRGVAALQRASSDLK